LFTITDETKQGPFINNNGASRKIIALQARAIHMYLYITTYKTDTRHITTNQDIRLRI